MMTTKVTLQMLKEANGKWFSPKNKKFFGDISYQVLHGKRTGNPYLVRSTYAWSDMLDRPKVLHWRINLLDPENLKIRSLIHKIFDSLEDVKDWLETEEAIPDEI